MRDLVKDAVEALAPRALRKNYSFVFTLRLYHSALTGKCKILCCWCSSLFYDKSHRIFIKKKKKKAWIGIAFFIRKLQPGELTDVWPLSKSSKLNVRCTGIVAAQCSYPKIHTVCNLALQELITVGHCPAS